MLCGWFKKNCRLPAASAYWSIATRSLGGASSEAYVSSRHYRGLLVKHERRVVCVLATRKPRPNLSPIIPLGDSGPAQGATSHPRSPLACLNVAKSLFAISSRYRCPSETLQSGLYDSEFISDLEKRKAEIVPRPSLQIHSQPLAMHSKIFECLVVSQPNVGVDDILDSFCHVRFSLREKAGGRYTVGFFLRLPARFPVPSRFRAEPCFDLVNEKLTQSVEPSGSAQ